MNKERIANAVIERLTEHIPEGWGIQKEGPGVLKITIKESQLCKVNLNRVYELASIWNNEEKAINVFVNEVLEWFSLVDKVQEITLEDIYKHGRIILRNKKMYLPDQRMILENTLLRILDLEVCMLYVVDHDNFSMTIANDTLKKLNLTKDEVYKITYENIVRAYETAGTWKKVEVKLPIKLHQLTLGNESHYTSSMALIPKAWEDAKKVVGSEDIIGIIPTNDTFFVCRDNQYNRRIMSDLASFLCQGSKGYQKPVSEKVWRMRNETLESLLIL